MCGRRDEVEFVPGVALCWKAEIVGSEGKGRSERSRSAFALSSCATSSDRFGSGPAFRLAILPHRGHRLMEARRDSCASKGGVELDLAVERPNRARRNERATAKRDAGRAFDIDLVFRLPLEPEVFRAERFQAFHPEGAAGEEAAAACSAAPLARAEERISDRADRSARNLS